VRNPISTKAEIDHAQFSSARMKTRAPLLNLKLAACRLALLVVHRGFGSSALSFAQRSLLLLPSLFILSSCARCPLSFSSVSAVIWLECHLISVMGPIDFGPDNYIYARVRVLPVLLFAP
jgi:hypothetical protein